MNRRALAGAAAVCLLATSCGLLPTSSPTAPVPLRSAGTTSALLLDLEIRSAAAIRDDYDRDAFGQRWSDDVAVDGGHNGCDTRNDLLRRDLVEVVIKPGTHGCVAAAGTLHDPYTGRTIQFVRGPDSDQVQIEHAVALADAWAAGAWAWDQQQRADFANDPLNLLAVDGPTNMAKGADTAADWLPPNDSYRCQYIARQVTVKHLYGLSITDGERAAMDEVLQSCPGEPTTPPAAAAIPALANS